MPNMIVRIVSGVLMLALLVGVLYSSKMVFYVGLFVITILAAMEWQGMINKHLPVFPWKPFGVAFILVFAYGASFIYYTAGAKALLMVMLVAIVTDTGAYFFGKLLKGPKLSPRTSPNKTWSGFLGGLLCASFLPFVWVLLGGELPEMFAKLPTHILMISAAVLSICGQYGDLFESAVKRKARVKDSGSLIPGHGGVLDRIDSQMFVLPAAALMIKLFV